MKRYTAKVILMAPAKSEPASGGKGKVAQKPEEWEDNRKDVPDKIQEIASALSPEDFQKLVGEYLTNKGDFETLDAVGRIQGEGVKKLAHERRKDCKAFDTAVVEAVRKAALSHKNPAELMHARFTKISQGRIIKAGSLNLTKVAIPGGGNLVVSLGYEWPDDAS